MNTHGSTIGIHAIRPGPHPGSVMPMVRAAVTRGKRWRLVKGVDNAGIAWEVKRESPGTLTITRFVRAHDDACQGIETWTDQEIETAAQRSVQIVFDRTSPEEQEAADWFEVLNEADPPGTTGWRNLGRLCKRIAEIATARKIHVALPAFNAGTPEYDEMQAFVGTGVMGTLARGGHLLTTHEGILDWSLPIDTGFGDLLPGAPSVPRDAGSFIGRFRYLYELVPEADRPYLVISEFYAGAYRQEPQEIVRRLAWADAIYRRYWYVLAVLPFTSDPTSDWAQQDYTYAFPAVLEYVIAQAEVSNMAGLVMDGSKYQTQVIDSTVGPFDPDNWIVDWDWDQVAHNEAEVVIIRLGDGYNLDPVFYRLREGLIRIKKKWGVYFLYRPNLSLDRQMDLIATHQPTLPPAGFWPDLEVTGGLAPRSAALFSATDTFLQTVDRFYRIICGMYSAAWYLDPNFSKDQQLALSLQGKRPGWFAGYPNLTIPQGYKDADPDYVLHQFTDSYMFRGVPRRADANRFKPGLDWRSLVIRTDKEYSIMFYIRGTFDDQALIGKLDALVQAAVRDGEENGRVLAYGEPDPTLPPPTPDPVECPYPYQARAKIDLALRDVRGDSLAGAFVPKGAEVTVHMVLSRIGPNKEGKVYVERAVLATDGRNCWADVENDTALERIEMEGLVPEG